MGLEEILVISMFAGFMGLLLIGLSGVVSARDITVTYENVTGKITLPEGFKVRYDSYDSSWSAVYYQKEGSPIEFSVVIVNILDPQIDDLVGKYPLDDADLRIKREVLYVGYNEKEKKLVALNNGHKAVVAPYRYIGMDVKDGISVSSYTMGKEIVVSGFSKEMISVEDKRIIYQVLMSLDF